MFIKGEMSWHKVSNVFSYVIKCMKGCDYNQMKQTWQSTKGLGCFWHSGIKFHLAAWQALVGLFQTQVERSLLMFLD